MSLYSHCLACTAYDHLSTSLPALSLKPLLKYKQHHTGFLMFLAISLLTIQSCQWHIVFLELFKLMHCCRTFNAHDPVYIGLIFFDVNDERLVVVW